MLFLRALVLAVASRLATATQYPFLEGDAPLHAQHVAHSLRLLERFEAKPQQIRRIRREADRSAALASSAPLIDTHVDLASTIRVISRRPLDAIDELGVQFPGQITAFAERVSPVVLTAHFSGHFDLPRARKGRVGGVFLTANAPCPAAIGQDPGPDFLGVTESVAHVLESMDLIYAFARRYPEVSHGLVLRLQTADERLRSATLTARRFAANGSR